MYTHTHNYIEKSVKLHYFVVFSRYICIYISLGYIYWRFHSYVIRWYDQGYYIYISMYYVVLKLYEGMYFYMLLLGKLCRKYIYCYIRGVVVETIFGIYMHIPSQYSTILFLFFSVYIFHGLLKNNHWTFF